MPDASPLPLWRKKIDVERVKREGLSVDLERLERDGYESLTPEEFYRLKTWGVCSQRTPGLHMVRVRIPGGRLSAGQLRGVASISLKLADGDAHITSRQNLELHGIPSTNVRALLRGLGELGLTTRSACGHTVRNIVGCSVAGICPEETFDVRPTVQAIHDFFLTRADHYNSRLPRRLNVYVAGCPSCMAHAQINDLGFVAAPRGDEPGFQFWCAGSLATNPRLAHLLLGFVPVEEAVAVCEAVADVYCEHGFRERPAKARLKFLVEEWGTERFTAAVMERLSQIRPGTRVTAACDAPVLGADRRSAEGSGGVFPQKQDGYVRVEARVPLGDLSQTQMLALASVAESHSDSYLHLTREQNAELHWVRAESASHVSEILDGVGLRPKGAGSLVDIQVCAGTEWCIWGVGDSRGLARDLEDALGEVADADPDASPLRVSISGCHHGCAQHQAADVGLQAVKSSDGAGSDEGFEFYGGGRLGADPCAGRRLGRVPLAGASSATVRLLTAYVKERLEGESFPEFVDRAGRDRVQLERAQALQGAQGE